MSIKRISVLLFCLWIFSSSGYSFEKTGTTSFQFLKVIPTARAASMAGAYSSIANTSDAVFWNPAGLINVNGLSAAVGYADWFLDVKHYSFSAAYNIERVGTIALFGMMSDIGEIEVTRVSALGFVNGSYNPGLIGESIKPGASVFGISFARQLTDKFNFGLTVKYASEDLVFEKADAIIFDGGLTFNTGFRSINLAVALRNFGPEIQFINKSYPLPQTLNIGISSYLISPADPLITSVSDHSLLIAYDMIQPRDFNQQHSVGMEYSFSDMLFLRGGYTFNSDQEGLSAGAGVLFGGYTIDYAFNDYGDYLDAVHRISIGFNF